MAKITVARALTKLKIILIKLNDLNRSLKRYGYVTSKTTSQLSSHKDINANHLEAKKEYAKLLASFDDLITDYTQISLAISKSNLETTIHTDELGTISIAEAMLLTQKLDKPLSDKLSALSSAREEAEKLANATNKSINAVSSGMTAEDIEKLRSLPVTLFDQEVLDNAAKKSMFCGYELNQLINESNAITMIEIPD